MTKTTQSNTLVVALIALLCISCASPQSPHVYELVLSGGRVIDPETGLDAKRDVAIENGRIVAVSEGPLKAAERLDVSGLLVSPGFIDLHNHSPTPLSQRYQAFDGVTTSLELEAGAYPAAKFGKFLAKGAAINYGASSSHAVLRIQLKQQVSEHEEMLDSLRTGVDFNGKAFKDTASNAEIEQLRIGLEKDLDAGGLGIGVLLDYMSAAINDAELAMIFEVAGERGAPVFVHIRRGIAGDISGLEEVIDLAARFNTPVHVCHISHNAMKNIKGFLAAIQAARSKGVDITTEVLPYNAGSTTISAAVFYRDWKTIFDISYEDVEWAETGERLNSETWYEYQKNDPKGSVIHHYLKEQWTKDAVAGDGVMVVTDGLPILTEQRGVPPQGIGSFAKVLGKYARDESVLSVNDALAKMTSLPAQRLEKWAPAFKRKGRIQEGMDADITVFDPATIKANTSYQRPYKASTGVAHVLVNGQFIVRDGVFQDAAKPGKRILAND